MMGEGGHGEWGWGGGMVDRVGAWGVRVGMVSVGGHWGWGVGWVSVHVQSSLLVVRLSYDRAANLWR